MAVPDVTGHSIEQLISLAGKTAVVTGGARGLGKAIARRLAQAGAAVVIADIDAASAAATADSLGAEIAESRVVGTQLDVTDTSSITEAVRFAIEKFGTLDIWVNNAGVYPVSPALELADDEWDHVVAVNMRGTFVGSREAARAMVDHGGGVIVNLASTAAYKSPGPGMAHYAATKASVVGITRHLALEFADRGVRVLAVAPTVIVTEGVEAAMQQPLEEAGLDLQSAYTGPLGRPGVPDDVARVVLFCVSDLALLMTGSTIAVDSGELTR